MFKKVKGGRLKFSLRPTNAAHEVFLAGDFTEWKPVQMQEKDEGCFERSLRVPPGTHEYKFLIGQQWITDPDNSEWARNPYGTMNSVAAI